MRQRHSRIPMDITLDKLQEDDVASVARALTSARADDPTVLDLRGMSSRSRSQSQLDFTAMTLLANLLLTSLRRKPLTVRIPSSGSVLQRMASAGLWFALAQRGSTELLVEAEEGQLVTSVPAVARLDPWRGRWDPADREFRSSVWGAGTSPYSGHFSTVSKTHIAFINPHLSVGRDRLVKELSDNVLSHWFEALEQRLDPEILSSAHEVVAELLYNLSVHPFSSIASRPPLQRDISKDQRFGLVSLFVTSGGGGETLHILVSDTGHGIPATLRPKFRKSDQSGLGEDEDLIRKMLEGSLPPYGRAEGRGFPELVSLGRRLGGSLTIATNADRGISNTLVADASTSGDIRVRQVPHFDIAGTIVHMVIGVNKKVDQGRSLGSPILEDSVLTV